jgi:hypothetical protein
LRDLAAAAAGEELERPLPPFEWNPAAVAEVTARIKLRRELRLPSRECVVRKPPPEADHCLCLAEAIDAAIASGQPTIRDEILKAARQDHAARWAWLKRKPQSRPEPIAKPRHESRPKPLPKPKADVVTETPTKPFRVVRKVRRWYDDEPGIMDRQF